MEFPDDEDNNEDDYDDDGRYQQLAHPPLPYDTIDISHYLTDDLYSGLSSKDIYHRTETESNLNIRLSVENELNFYVRHFLQPRICEILSNTRYRFFLWVAGKTRKQGGLSDRMSICLPICPSVFFLSVCHPPSFLSVCLSDLVVQTDRRMNRQSVCLSVVCLSVCLSVYSSVCLSVRLSD